VPGRTITKFTRTYEEFDPDGAGNGPPTWILATPGAASGGAVITGGKTALVSAIAGATPIQIGQALAMTSGGELRLADATADATATCVGLALTSAGAGSLLTYTSDGQVSLADWSAVTGSAALVPGTRYFLNPVTPGGLTNVCPTTPGVYAAPVGVALSTTLLEVEINLPVKQ